LWRKAWRIVEPGMPLPAPIVIVRIVTVISVPL
jgi:hypothetical protein